MTELFRAVLQDETLAASTVTQVRLTVPVRGKNLSPIFGFSDLFLLYFSESLTKILECLHLSIPGLKAETSETLLDCIN